MLSAAIVRATVRRRARRVGRPALPRARASRARQFALAGRDRWLGVRLDTARARNAVVMHAGIAAPFHRRARMPGDPPPPPALGEPPRARGPTSSVRLAMRVDCERGGRRQTALRPQHEAAPRDSSVQVAFGRARESRTSRRKWCGCRSLAHRCSPIFDVGISWTDGMRCKKTGYSM